MAQQSTRREPAQPTLINSSNLGINVYTDPTLTNPRQWYKSSNVFSGPFGFLQRARFAHLVTSSTSGYTPQNSQFLSLFNYFPPGFSYYVLGDINGFLYSFDTNNSYAATLRINPLIYQASSGSALLDGPWMRQVLQDLLYEMNGQVKQTGRGANAGIIEGFGIDAPDVSPQIVVSAGASQTISSITRSNGVTTVTLAAALTVPGGNDVGMINVSGVADTSYNGTFVVINGSGTTTLTYNNEGNNGSSSGGTVDVNITKAVGRSYAFAWENANKPHVGPPSPSSQYILYSAQNGAITPIEYGTVSAAAHQGATSIITGTGTYFTSAWIGKHVWTVGGGDSGLIISVQDSTHLTVGNALAVAIANAEFVIFDPQCTHIRLYMTADGGATYYRVQRNQFNSPATTFTTAGLEFYDSANAEPPNFPFTTETSQLYNLPPPIGKYLFQYMGQLCVFGIEGAGQTFFYSNQGVTTIGMPQESFAPLNQITIPIQGANINGMAAFPSSLVVWDDKEDMFRITGLLSDNTDSGVTAAAQGATIQQLPFALGCASPFAVTMTPLGAIWLTPQNEIWLYTDYYAPRNVGRPIQGILNTILRANLGLVRSSYYHTDTRNWVIFSIPSGNTSSNNKLLILDLDLLDSNGSPSFFVFDMATKHPSWWQFDLPAPAIATIYEQAGNVRAIIGGTDDITDVDYLSGFGTEYPSVSGYVTLHAFGNQTAFAIMRPSFFRFLTNQMPISYSAQGWSFYVNAMDDDAYTFANPLVLNFIPGTNDVATLSGFLQGDPLSLAEPFRWSQALFRIGGIYFIAGRRLQIGVNFPTTPGVLWQYYGCEMGFAFTPPR